MAFLRVNRATTGAPRDTDVNQYAKALSGEEDVGTLSLAAPVDAPTSAGSGVATLGSELGVGTYTYAMTYITGHKRSNGVIDPVVGETTASPTWTVTTTAGSQQVSLTSLPVPTNVVVVAKRLYRTAVGGSQRKLVATLAAGLTSYVDATPDASLGANEPTTNTTGSSLSGYVSEGRTNQDVSFVKALIQATHTRSVVYTYTSGNVTKIEEKDGSTVVKTTDIAYKASGDPDYIDETVEGVVVRTTFGYNADGTISQETRTVS